MTRVALLTECRVYDQNRTPEEHLISVGGNTGNNAYVTALKDIFGAAHVNYGQLNKCLEEDLYDIYLVGNLSWIVENTPLPPFYYDAFKKITNKGKRFIPISVGTQVHDYKADFKYHPETIEMLREISDQAIIACRGYYTEEILNKNGIKNTETIGCPSLYHRRDPNFKVVKQNKPISKQKVATGITPWPSKKMSKDMVKKYLKYSMDNDIDFIEQANTNWIDLITKSDEKFKIQFLDYWERKSRIYYSIDEWREYSRKMDFSFSGRFHGNVIPLLEGVPALFITIDARTREMCEYFQFPTIDILDFNFNQTIDDLYESTNYTRFNNNYRNIYNKFEKFVTSNGLSIVY